MMMRQRRESVQNFAAEPHDLSQIARALRGVLGGWAFSYRQGTPVVCLTVHGAYAHGLTGCDVQHTLTHRVLS